MKKIKINFILLLGANFLFGANLELYQDQAIYKYESNSTFIGFSKGIKATCKDKNLELVYKLKCPNNRLCKFYNNINNKQLFLNKIKENIQTINILISNRKIDSFDANMLLKNAQIIAQEKSTLKNKELKIKKVLQLQNQEFRKIITAKEPLHLTKKCNGEIKLLIPYSYLNFRVVYEANINNKEITIKQNLSILNRSGIDIKVKDAKFYYRNLNEYIEPINFTPWIVKELKNRILYKKTKRLDYDNMALNTKGSPKIAEQAIAPAPIGKYNDAREYSIKNLLLPTSNKPTKVKILEYKSNVDCKLKSYSYRNTNVFYICTFKPKFQIDTNSWQVKESNKLINKDAIGRYQNRYYELYTKIDKDILIKRKRVVAKENQSGIFGGTKRQKDGFLLNIINKSKKSKKIQIIERIPTSNTNKIEVKLLSVSKGVNYILKKDGKITINLELKPKENKKIEILFEISYNKDLKIIY